MRGNTAGSAVTQAAMLRQQQQQQQHQQRSTKGGNSSKSTSATSSTSTDPITRTSFITAAAAHTAAMRAEAAAAASARIAARSASAARTSRSGGGGGGSGRSQSAQGRERAASPAAAIRTYTRPVGSSGGGGVLNTRYSGAAAAAEGDYLEERGHHHQHRYYDDSDSPLTAGRRRTPRATAGSLTGLAIGSSGGGGGNSSGGGGGSLGSGSSSSSALAKLKRTSYSDRWSNDPAGAAAAASRSAGGLYSSGTTSSGGGAPQRSAAPTPSSNYQDYLQQHSTRSTVAYTNGSSDRGGGGSYLASLQQQVSAATSSSSIRERLHGSIITTTSASSSIRAMGGLGSAGGSGSLMGTGRLSSGGSTAGLSHSSSTHWDSAGGTDAAATANAAGSKALQRLQSLGAASQLQSVRALAAGQLGVGTRSSSLDAYYSGLNARLGKGATSSNTHCAAANLLGTQQQQQQQPAVSRLHPQLSDQLNIRAAVRLPGDSTTAADGTLSAKAAAPPPRLTRQTSAPPLPDYSIRPPQPERSSAGAAAAAAGPAGYAERPPSGSGLFLSASRASSYASYQSAFSTESFASAHSRLAPGGVRRLSDGLEYEQPVPTVPEGSGGIGSSCVSSSSRHTSRSTSGGGAVDMGNAAAPIGSSGRTSGGGAAAVAAAAAVAMRRQGSRGGNTGAYAASAVAAAAEAAAGRRSSSGGSSTSAGVYRASDHTPLPRTSASAALRQDLASAFVISTQRLTEDEAGQHGVIGVDGRAEDTVGRLMSRLESTSANSLCSSPHCLSEVSGGGCTSGGGTVAPPPAAAAAASSPLQRQQHSLGRQSKQLERSGSASSSDLEDHPPACIKPQQHASNQLRDHHHRQLVEAFSNCNRPLPAGDDDSDSDVSEMSSSLSTSSSSSSSSSSRLVQVPRSSSPPASTTAADVARHTLCGRVAGDSERSGSTLDGESPVPSYTALAAGPVALAAAASTQLPPTDGSRIVSHRAGPHVKPRGSVGLTNLGNTCFMNSILQCLNCVPELVDRLVNGPRVSGGERRLEWSVSSSSSSTKPKVAPAFAELLREMWSGGRVTVNPTRFLDAVANYDSRWGEGYQQDCEEFLHSLLTALQVQYGGRRTAFNSGCSSRLSASDSLASTLLSTTN